MICQNALFIFQENIEVDFFYNIPQKYYIELSYHGNKFYCSSYLSNLKIVNVVQYVRT